MRLILSLAAGLLIASSVAAEDLPRQPTAIVFRQGTCNNLAHDTETMAGCKDVLAGFRYSDSRESFIFIDQQADGQLMISFSGRQSTETTQADGTIVRPIDLVVTGASAETLAGLAAVGECTFTPPEQGATVIACSAQTDKGTFTGRFTTDGKPPEVQGLQ